MKKTTATLIIVSLLVLVSQLALAGSATWSANPTSDDWNTATNWTPNTVPNGPADIATFAFSNLASVTINKSTTVDSIVFDAGASAYTITDAAIKPLNIIGAGIVNESGLEQNLQVTEVAEIEMMNSATISGPTSIYLAGTSMTFDDDAGFIVFSDSSSRRGCLHYCRPDCQSLTSPQSRLLTRPVQAMRPLRQKEVHSVMCVAVLSGSRNRLRLPTPLLFVKEVHRHRPVEAPLSFLTMPARRLLPLLPKVGRPAEPAVD